MKVRRDLDPTRRRAASHGRLDRRSKLTIRCIPLVACLALACLAAGCASMEYSRDMGQSELKGIRYYDVSPYLIATTTATGHLDIRLEYLPDPNKKMSVLPKAKGAKLDTTLTFDKGRLTKMTASADATVIPKAILDAAKSVITSGLLDLAALAEDAPKVAAVPKTHTVPGPRIFKLIVRSDGAFLVGGGMTTPFEITLQAPPPATKKTTASASTPAKGGSKS